LGTREGLRGVGKKKCRNHRGVSRNERRIRFCDARPERKRSNRPRGERKKVEGKTLTEGLKGRLKTRGGGKGKKGGGGENKGEDKAMAEKGAEVEKSKKREIYQRRQGGKSYLSVSVSKRQGPKAVKHDVRKELLNRE